MWCPNCTSEHTRVTFTDKGHVVERFRKCDSCGYTFATVEGVKHDPTWQTNAEYTDEEITRILKKRHTNQKDIFND